MNKNALTKANITTLHFLLYILARAERPSARTLCDISGLSRVTVYRYFETLESMYGIRVKFHPISTGRRVRTGYYALESWGILDEAAFLAFMDERLEELHGKEQADA